MQICVILNRNPCYKLGMSKTPTPLLCNKLSLALSDEQLNGFLELQEKSYKGKLPLAYVVRDCALAGLKTLGKAKPVVSV